MVWCIEDYILEELWDMPSKSQFPRSTATSPVHKLLGNVSATLGFFGNFQLVEQL